MRDRNHYGRERLFTYLLNTSDSAVWVVGSRRIGKTSLLRQLEYLTDTPQSDLVPLFWDMQGCANSGDLSFELFMAVEDEAARFGAFGVSVARAGRPGRPGHPAPRSAGRWGPAARLSCC